MRLGCCTEAEKTSWKTSNVSKRSAQEQEKVWLTYMDYIDTLKFFIRAKRVGNWNMHIIAVCRMRNLLAATGYFNYAKSARMYLQLMLELPAGHPGCTNNLQSMVITQSVKVIVTGPACGHISQLSK